jgi:hypothetical protein
LAPSCQLRENGVPALTSDDELDRLQKMRAAIGAQIVERDADFPEAAPRFPWNLVTQAQSYVFHLPVKLLRQIRLHADTINGTLGSNYYLNFPPIDGAAAVEANGYLFLGEGVPMSAWAREHDIPDMPALRFGFAYKGLTLCDLTVVRQQNICNLHRLLKDAPALPGRFTFIEIGAGYGSFALDAIRMLSNAAYVIVDLPETLIYSAAYLMTHLPKRRAYVYAPGDDVDAELAKTDNYDLAFIPNYRATALSGLPHVDVAFNSISFPEMGPQNTRDYISLIAPKLRRYFMSVNHRYFRQTEAHPLTGVDAILGEYLHLFPTMREYEAQLGISSADHDDINFWPTVIGTTPVCHPVSDVELRCVSPQFGRARIRGASLTSAASIERINREDPKPRSGFASAVRRLVINKQSWGR